MNIKLIKTILTIFFLFTFIIETNGQSGWAQLSSMPTPRYGVCSAKLGKNIYVIGGVEYNSYNHSEEVSKVVEMYNTETDHWDRSIEELDEKRYNGVAVAFNEKIYVFGGKEKQNELVKNIEVYDAVLNRWADDELEMPDGREGATAVVHDEKIYLIGGIDSHGRYLDKIDIFDPQTNEWSSSLFYLNVQRAFLTAVSVKNTIYVLGGYAPDPIDQVEKFIPGVGWQNISNMSTQRASFAACTINDTIYVMGGRGQTEILRSAEALVTTTNSWSSKARLTKARYSFSAQTVENKIYIFGGSNSSEQFISDVEVFTLSASVDIPETKVASDFLLLQNYPNPFNSQTVIKYHLSAQNNYSASNHLSLSIYNISGQQVTVLLDKQQQPGSYQISWQGKDNFGNNLPSGIYFCALKYGSSFQKIKLLFTK